MKKSIPRILAGALALLAAIALIDVLCSLERWLDGWFVGFWAFALAASLRAAFCPVPERERRQRQAKENAFARERFGPHWSAVVLLPLWLFLAALLCLMWLPGLPWLTLLLLALTGISALVLTLWLRWGSRP